MNEEPSASCELILRVDIQEVLGKFTRHLVFVTLCKEKTGTV